VRTGSEFRKRHGGNRGFVRQQRRIDEIVIDHHRRIQ
jgi:hypothetical protein